MSENGPVTFGSGGNISSVEAAMAPERKIAVSAVMALVSFIVDILN